MPAKKLALGLTLAATLASASASASAAQLPPIGRGGGFSA